MCVIRSVRICKRFISCCMPFFFISTIYICKAQWFNDRINKETKKTKSLKYKTMTNIDPGKIVFVLRFVTVFYKYQYI